MSQRAVFKFRLYVAGEAQNSALAIANLNALCQAHLLNRHSVEVKSWMCSRNPSGRWQTVIFMTPSLMKLSPSPKRKIIGTLGQTGVVMAAMGLQTAAA